MKTIHFTETEIAILSPLTEKRRSAWKEYKISDAPTRNRFERTYLLLLENASSKLASELSQKYSIMERAILTGCIKEWRDELVLEKKRLTGSNLSEAICDLLKKLNSENPASTRTQFSNER